MANEQNSPVGGGLQDVVTNLLSGVNYLGQLVTIWRNAIPRATGTFTMPAAATFNVADVRAQTNSIVQISPTNASAGTLQGSVKSLYVSSVTSGVGFTVATANATNAAGTETFSYTINNPV